MATEVSISIKAKVGAVGFEIESSEGDVIHHMTGSDFLKQLMDFASLIAHPDEDVPVPSFLRSTLPSQAHVLPPAIADAPPTPPAPTQPAGDPVDESHMGSVQEFISKRPGHDGVERYEVDGQSVEQEPIFKPGDANADRPHKTFGNKVQYDDTPEGRKKKEAMERLSDPGGWSST